MNDATREELLRLALEPDSSGSSGSPPSSASPAPSTSSASSASNAADDAEQAAEFEQLRAFVQRTRKALDPERTTRDWSDLREGALVGKILARTTGEDLSWRGELRLVSGFLRDRLAGSPLLKIVAASLLLHIVALPVFAYLVTRAPAQRDPLQIRMQPATVEDPFGPASSKATVEPVPEGALERAGADFESALRRARFVLSTSSGPLLAQEAGASLETKLVAARTSLLAERTWKHWLDEGISEETDWTEATPLARVLWAEILLDRLVLQERRSPWLATALNDLALSSFGGSTGELAEACLLRARAYDAWEAPVGFDPSAAPLPLGRAWFEMLRRAADPELLPPDVLDEFEGWIRP